MTDPFTLGTDAHTAWLRGQTTALLRFYEQSADLATGGFDELSTTGTRMGRPKPLFATARMTYGFTLGHLLGHPGSAALVEHGLAALRTMFHDDEASGWFSTIGAGGVSVDDDSKHTYAHAFVLLATAAASQAGLGGDDMVAEASEIFDRRLYEQPARLCVDVWDRRWTTCDPYRGMNANMHTVEAFLGAYAATSDSVFLERARAIAARMIAFAESTNWRIPEHFTTDWQPQPEFNADNPNDQFRPYGATPGHGLEWSRLLLQLRLTTTSDAERSALLSAATQLFDRAVRDGWDDAQHGFAYTVDWDGRPVATQRLHWPVAEAIGAARYLSDATGDPSYARWYERFWELADRDFIDREHGSWWHELDVDGRPGATIWQGKGDLYHALQATLFGQLPAAPTLVGVLAGS